jgi:hypothetical protein
MFTREDYIRYFEQLAHVERKMIYLVNDMVAQLSDEQVINNLRRIAADEAKHYTFILDLLSAHLEFSKHGEHRLSVRAHTLGPVDLTVSGGAASGGGFRGYCSNLSKNGMCLESSQSFQPGETYSLKIMPYDHHGPALERKGRVVWMREILDFYIGGIAFEL